MKLMLHVAPGIVRYPLIASAILETGALVNIERASIDAVSGEIVLEVPRDKCLMVKEAFERRGVTRSCPWKFPSSEMRMSACIAGRVFPSARLEHSVSRIGGSLPIRASAFSVEPASWAALSVL